MANSTYSSFPFEIRTNTMSLSPATNANLVWATNGAGDIGSADLGVTLNGPNNIFAGNYLQVGDCTNFFGPSSGAGYLSSGVGANNFTFSGSNGSDMEIGFQDSTGNATWFGRTVGTTPAGQTFFRSSDGQFRLDANAGAIFGKDGETNYVVPGVGLSDGDSIFVGQSDSLNFSGSSFGISFTTIGTFFGVYGTSPVASIFASGQGRFSSLGVGNSASATVAVGTLTKKIEIFDDGGTSLGFIPVYATIT